MPRRCTVYIYIPPPCSPSLAQPILLMANKGNSPSLLCLPSPLHLLKNPPSLLLPPYLYNIYLPLPQVSFKIMGTWDSGKWVQVLNQVQVFNNHNPKSSRQCDLSRTRQRVTNPRPCLFPVWTLLWSITVLYAQCICRPSLGYGSLLLCGLSGVRQALLCV